MNRNVLSIAALSAALVLATGCGKKTPDKLPPAPPTGTAGGAGTVGSETGGFGNEGTAGGAAVPGSRADFLQSIPSDRILFQTDSFSLDSEDRAVLDAQVAWLQRNPAVRVTIEGHADERGTREYNLALGDRRANSAASYLQSRGISAARMSVVSWGKERPAALGSDESAWAQNRRAVTVIPQ